MILIDHAASLQRATTACTTKKLAVHAKKKTRDDMSFEAALTLPLSKRHFIAVSSG